MDVYGRMACHNRLIPLQGMAQHATATSRKKDVGLPAFASITASDIVRAPVVQRTVPLDLLPLLKPFKRSGRLALRIERLPQRAKFSAGRRNSDGSWSLASDELEDLNYLIPSNIAAAHELTIRIMKFDDGAASTLKVIQYPVAAYEADPEPPADEEAVCRSTEQNDPVLRSQLGEMQSLFAIRESELTELRAALERANEEKTAELEKARAAWELELNQRLADAAAKAQSDKKRARQNEHDLAERDSHLIAQAEARAQQRIAAQCDRWQAEAERRMEAERQSWLAQTDKRVTVELERLKALAEQRLEAERQSWQTQTDQRVASELERLKAQTAQRIETERQSWQAEADQRRAAELERLKTEAEQRIESERKTWQAGTDQHVVGERERLKGEAEQRLAAERQAWQAEADRRLAAEFARLKAEAEQQIAAERKNRQADADSRAIAELERLKAQMEQRIEAERQAWQALADQRTAAELARRQAEADQRFEGERKTWQAEADRRVEAERRRWEAQNAAALGEAETHWKAQESERSAAARSEWQQLSARMLAEEADKSRRLETALVAEADKGRKLEAALEALVQARNVPTQGGETHELDRLRSELAVLQATLAERDNELAQRQAEAEQDRDHRQREADAALETAAKDWKAEESARLDAAVAKIRAQSEAALAELTSRCERAERALADAGSQPAAADDGYIQGLRTEVAELRQALANQEVELGWARAALDESQPLHLRRAGENLPIGNFEGPAGEEPEADANAGAKRTLIRDCLLVVGLVVPLILFYPWIAVYLPDNVRTGLASVTGGLLSVGDDRPAVTRTAPPPAAPVVQRPTATVAKAVNVRATPAVKGAVVVTLQKGASVIILEQPGNWTHVEVPAKTGKAQQGWVYSTYLESKKAAN